MPFSFSWREDAFVHEGEQEIATPMIYKLTDFYENM